MLNQPYGKDNLEQFFVSEAALRHILLPLWKSGLVAPDDWATFRRVSPYVDQLLQLWDELALVDFNPLRGFQPDWEQVTEVCPHRVKMVSAALLHFDGDAAALVRWMGGPHVHGHRDVPAMLKFFEGKLAPPLVADLRRIFTAGIPRTCASFSSEDNFQAFYNYGNHKSANSAPDKALKALVKDARRGFVIPFDKRVIPFVLNCHVTPQGVRVRDKGSKTVSSKRRMTGG
jgi:hypothetical protein